MSFFGLTEFQKISQYIFEETFNLRFAIPFEQHNSTLSMQAFESLASFQKKKIKDINALDIELYDFAKQLMFQRYVKWPTITWHWLNSTFSFLLFNRFEKLKAKDNDFEFRFSNLGNLVVKNGGTEFNWESNIDNVQWFLFKIKQQNKKQIKPKRHI